MSKAKPENVKAEMYLSDPLVARKYASLGVQEVELKPGPVVLDGPVSSRVAVVDYDTSQDTLYPAARFDAKERRFKAPLDSHEFRQINAWATVQHTLEMYEDAQTLGRRIPWGFDGNRLLVLPHAGYWENAFYDRKTKTLQFFYFEANDERIYTCLSHDIVSHETGHAILDGIRPLYNFPSSPDTGGFHESLGDITAILAALQHRTYVVVTIEEAKRDLRNDTIVAALAEQFGTALYGGANRYFLRNALNEKTMKDVEDSWEEHEYSEVLTGAVYEILIGMYDQQWKREQKKAAEAGHKPSPVKALLIAVRHLQRLALRALDYCPPADVSYLDYAQAMLKADSIAYPVDNFKYRNIVKKVCLRRGIARNEKELEPHATPPRSAFAAYEFANIDDSPVAAYHFLDRNRKVMEIPENQDLHVVALYGNAKEGDRKYQMPRELILEYAWEHDIPLRGKRFGNLDGKSYPLLCGGTMVFDERANLLYWSPKLAEPARIRRLEDYVAYLVKQQLIGVGDSPSALSRPFRTEGTARKVRMSRNPLAMHSRNR